MSLSHHCVLDSRQDVAQKRASPNKVRNLFQLIDGNLEILELLPKKNSNSTKSSLSIQNMQPVELSNKNKKQQLESREPIVVQQMPTKTRIGYYFQTLKCSTNTITTDQILNNNRTNNNISFNNTNANKSKKSLNNKQSFNKNIKFIKNDNNNKRNKYSLILRKYKNIKYLDKVCIFHIFLILAFLFNNLIRPTNALLTVASVDSSGLDGSSHSNYNSDIGIIGRGSSTNLSSTKENNNNNHNSNGGHYLDKLDNLERSVAAVLIKVAYGTTSTTKRSIPDNSYVPSLTTIATPPLTTLRYLEKSQHKQKVNLHHRNYELDLERDHALPTSAPNADILKSNSNPTYPNPNRHHNHDRDRHRHLLSSTPIPSMHTIPKKGQPTIPMYPGDMPSYSPPGRSFFTPPLPPEYQNPFADKPTLRGTNNEGTIVNTGLYINRRPIPPPSLMPGHERIPFRPPELNGQQNGGVIGNSPSTANMPVNTGASGGALSSTQSDTLSPSTSYNEDGQRKKTLNTPSQKINNKSGINYSGINSASNINNVPLTNGSDQVHTSGRVHFPSISRILSGSNGKKEDIPEVLLKQVTSRPSFHAPPSAPVLQTGGATDHEGVNRNPNINQSKNSRDDENDRINVSGVASTGINDNGELFDVSRNMGRDDTKNVGITQPDEPKTQPKIKMSTKSTESPATGLNSQIYSTQIIHNLANVNNEQSGLTTSTPGGGSSSPSSVPASKEASKITGKHGAATWAVAWNIHVYLSVILFTILAVYSCFKLIFYNKLTHLFNQSYFRCIHLILIVICISRIFYLCYDAYNIHSTFNIFVSEILLNLPATFLTISFSVLILFLLIKSLNHKNNRYSALIRPLTVVVGSSVHVGLCITLHYVESYTTSHSHLYYQQQTYRNGYRTQNSAGASGTSGLNINSVNGLSSPTLFNQHHQLTTPPPPPRVLSLICQIIYIFICLSLGLLYLYIYRILKRVLRSKSQNYIHGYQNLSYAIHITIATALLFVLLAALQIFGAISISTTRPLITTASEMDWLQWGYQFSLRLIEIAIITLMSWVAGLKTGGNSGVLQREKTADNHNVAGFFLPCTSSSSQEHFETDYPAVCNANTNLHTYTMRTGKPIYDDNFALNSLGSQNTASQNSAVDSGQIVNAAGQRIPANNDFQLQNDFVRTYDTGSMRSVVPQSQGALHGHHHHHQLDNVSGHNFDFMTDPQTDHYENPNFELRSNKIVDNCYSEPLNPPHSHPHSQNSGYDFANFERPIFGGGGVSHIVDRPNSRCDKTSGKQFKSNLDRSNYENPERRSSSSTHSCTNGRYPSYNSFEKRSGVRKSGTLNNIGGIVHGRNGSSSSSSSSSRPSGVQTLSTSHNRSGNNNSSARTIRAERDRDRDRREITNSSILGGGVNKAYYRSNGGGERAVISNHQSSLERSSSTVAKQFILPSDDDIVVGCNAERTNLINGSGSGITSSTSGGNLTDNGGVEIGCQPAATPSMSVSASSHILNEMPKNGGGVSIGGDNVNGGSGASASSGDSANSGSMLVAEHGFVRFRALDDINNAQGVGIHNASIRTTGRSKEKRYTNNT